MVKILYYTLLASFLFGLFSCANIGYPSGGEKDASPPGILNETPANKTLHFTAKEFVVVFDEFIQLRNVNQELIVNPPLEENPEVINLGKKMKVIINNPLDSNTTYVFNFNNAIVDNNEGNVLKNYQYVFSTGSHIDSFTLSGSIYNAFDLSIPEECLVLLHKNTSDSAIFNKQPNYIAKTDKDGRFTFTHLASETYRLYTLKDENNNLKYDLIGDEAIGFYDSILHVKGESFLFHHPHDTIDTNAICHEHETNPFFTFPLFYEEPPPARMYIKNIERKRNELIVAQFSRKNKDAPVFQIEGLDADNFLVSSSTNLDSFEIWLTDSNIIQQEKIVLYAGYYLPDSNSQTMKTDTFPLFAPIKKKGKSQDQPYLSVSHNIKSPFPHFSKINFSFNRPVEFLDKEKIILSRMQDTIKEPVDYNIENNLDQQSFINNLYLKSDWEEDVSYHLICYPGAFCDIYSTENDTIQIQFKTSNQNMYGSLKMDITGNPVPVIVQLLGRQDKIVRKEASEQPYFPNLTPGAYQLKLILDKNKDGKWTTGNVIQKRQPEDVRFFESPIDITGGWDFEQSWHLEEDTH